MKNLKIFKTLLFLTIVLAPGISALLASQVSAVAPGTAAIKGVNNLHFRSDNQAYAALDAIKSNGFNAVRIGWQTSGTAARLKQILDRCKTLGLKPIPELHDASGSANPAEIERLVNYWVGCKSILTPDIWLNIANEWGPDTGTVWRDTYKTAITKLRDAGLTNPLVIDAPGAGQDSQSIIRYGKELLAHDPQHNLIFSLHMFGRWNSPDKVKSELTAVKNQGLSVMVGAFGYNYNNGANNLNCKVDSNALITTCRELGIGYLAWAWDDNDEGNAWLDMTDAAGNLTSWGKLVANSLDPAPSTVSPVISPSNSSVTSLANFESNTENWSGLGIAGGPWVTSEWHADGSYSLKADVILGTNKQYSLLKTVAANFSGKKLLKATVRYATWGKPGVGLQAKLYLKCGPNLKRVESEATPVYTGTEGAVLSLVLPQTANLNDIREYGVQFNCGANSSGSSAIYLDNVTVQ